MCLRVSFILVIDCEPLFYVIKVREPTYRSQLLDESSTSTNLGNDHGLIKEYYLHYYEAFWEAQSKTMRAYARSGQYHTIVKSCVHLTWYQSQGLFINNV